MIRLTGYEDIKSPIIINPEKIDFVGVTDRGSTGIRIGAEIVHVTESPEEVARKVLEYRLAMDDHANAPNPYRNEAYKNLFKLAGLEEQKDE